MDADTLEAIVAYIRSAKDLAGLAERSVTSSELIGALNIAMIAALRLEEEQLELEDA